MKGDGEGEGTPCSQDALDKVGDSEGKGEWEADNEVSPGEPNDDEDDPERECTWG